MICSIGNAISLPISIGMFAPNQKIYCALRLARALALETVDFRVFFFAGTPGLEAGDFRTALVALAVWLFRIVFAGRSVMMGSFIRRVAVPSCCSADAATGATA